jgi:uncharacterized protein
MRDAEFPKTARTTLSRYKERAVYDRVAVHAILDKNFMCTVSFVHEGSPRAMPTGYGRIGDHLYIHGSHHSTMLNAVLANAEICISVAQIDGLMLGRSLFTHGLYYRSVVIFGHAERVLDQDEKRASFKAYAERFLAGRYEDVRPPNDKELNSVTVLRIPLHEAVAKVKSGPMNEDGHDLEWKCWTGVMSIKQTVCELMRSPSCPEGIDVPSYIRDYERLPGGIS